MKKFFKFLFATFSLAAAVLGVYYLVKNVLTKDNDDDDFDDLEDDFDDFETEKEVNACESREYVPINLSGSEETQEETSANYEVDEDTDSFEAEESTTSTEEDDNASDEE